MEGVVGEWEIVAPPPPPFPGEQLLVGEEDVNPGEAVADNAGQSEGGAGVPDNDGDIRHFRLRKRKLDLDLGDLWDPGAIPIKLKAPKTDAVEGSASVNGVLVASTNSGFDTQQQQFLDGAPDRPKWISKGWKRATQLEAETESAVAPLSHIEHGTPAHNDVDLTTGETVEPSSITTGDSRTGGTEKPSVCTPMNLGHEGDIDVKPVLKEEEASTQSMAPTALFRKRKIPARR